MTQSLKTELMTCGDFKGGQHPYPEMTIQASELQIGNETLHNVTLDGGYDRHLRLKLRCSAPISALKATIDKVEAFLIPHPTSEPIQLFLTNTQKNQGDVSICTLTPMVSPMLLTMTGDAVEIEAVLINGPEILWSGLELEFDHGQYQLKMREFMETKEVRKQADNISGDNIASGTVILARKDSSPIQPEDALRIFTHFHRFLTFVRGAHCGLGHILGKTSSGSVAFSYLEFLRADQFRISTGWCDMGVVRSLPEVFEGYLAAVSSELDANPILTTVEFYRAANIIRESSLEMAIVASHTALETIVPHILMSQASWSENLINRQISFHDKLRAAGAFIGVVVDLLEYSVALKARSKQYNDADAYELISIFRNRITHQGKSFKYTGKELMEIWTVSQWLCELFLFHLIGYRGQMNDRRQYQGWRGEMVRPVPLPNR